MPHVQKALLILVSVLLIASGAGYISWFGLPPAFSPSGKPLAEQPAVAVVAENLTVPWEVVFLPTGETLVAERSGTIVQLGDPRRSLTVEGVVHTGEAGLLGMTIHPDFSKNRWLYVYFTTQADGALSNRVERYVFENGALTQRTTILAGIPAAPTHDGGRIAFGPDGYLYITTGDAGKEASAQDRTVLSGKILRITDEGKLPADNPFGNEVYSYGHRNPQGLAWDHQDRLWSTEHGRSGARSGFDELNLVKKGANYGWPEIEGDQEREGMERPVAHSGASSTWAPAGLAYANGTLYFAGLRGQQLYQATLTGEASVSLSTRFAGEFGRLRAVVAHENFLYLTTSNTDGRGIVRKNDDKLLKITSE